MAEEATIEVEPCTCGGDPASTYSHSSQCLERKVIWLRARREVEVARLGDLTVRFAKADEALQRIARYGTDDSLTFGGSWASALARTALEVEHE